ncbi:MAG: hypothetical protein M5U19_16325 [Microthrixaceae bacterium]|nr:hypothetical protein [Microthrixaceae bacterium]
MAAVQLRGNRLRLQTYRCGRYSLALVAFVGLGFVARDRAKIRLVASWRCSQLWASMR